MVHINRTAVNGLLGLLLFATLSATAVAASTASPYYVTERTMDSTFEERGITINHKHRTVLAAACEGQGYGRGKFPFTRYHLFACYLNIGTGSYFGVHVTVTAKGHHWYYLATRL